MSRLPFVIVPLALTHVLHAQNPPPPALNNDEEYRVRDAVESSFVNLATFPVRPMAFDGQGNLWALNHHDSTIVRFDQLGPNKTTFPLPWGPVGVAFWPGESAGTADDRMIVACRGSWAVVVLDVTTGAIEHVYQLRPPATGPSSLQGQMAEPGDVLVVGDEAFVTCGGADTVLKIDLVTKSIVVFDEEDGLHAKHPLFLSRDAAGNVYVAPLISGNNTIAVKNDGGTYERLQAAANDVIRGVVLAGLPDDDLFRISAGSNAIAPVAWDVGTILFAHGINPATSKMWVLNTEALNDEKNSEPEANGVFAVNRITILPSTVLTLDPGAPAEGIGEMTGPIGQPYSLTFLDKPSDEDHGHAFLCGLLTDNVLELDSAGGFVKQWAIASDSAIPRQVLLNPDGSRLLVYCWGDNTIRSYDWAASEPIEVSSLSLGHDPTPQSLRAGRALFFDAQHSRHGNLSCATCHVEGGSDLLAWNLSNNPQDDKGPMVTQTLVGIERMAPFHWRGERSLSDFRGAFKGLLGKLNASGEPTDLGEEEFEQLEAYLFSLANPANPNQSRKRVLDDALTTPGAIAGLATEGQMAFNDMTTFAAHQAACHDCHPMPLGTLGDIIDEFPGLSQPRRAQMKPTPFHELWRKQMTVVSADFEGLDPMDFAQLGSGFSHVGVSKDLFSFIFPISAEMTHETDPEISPHDRNITAFVHQFDQGLGQAAHYAYLLEGTATVEDGLELGFLLDQALGMANQPHEVARRNCDIVVFGRVVDGVSGTPSRRRWFFDRYADVFRCDDPAFTTQNNANGERDLQAFLDHASAESNVFLGLPVGMGERFGVDYDMDGKFNAVDSRLYLPLQPVGGTVDFQHAGTAEAQVLWENAKTARLRFDTNLPTRYDVKFWPANAFEPAGPQVTTDVFSRNHTLLIGGLRPSTNNPGPNGAYLAQEITYNVEIEAIPRVGDSVTTTLSVTPDGFEEFTVFNATNPRQERLLLNHVIESMTMTPAGGHRTVVVDTVFKRGGAFFAGSFERVPAEGRVVLGRAFKQNTVTLQVTPLQVTAGTDTFLADQAWLSTSSSSTPENQLEIPLSAPLLVSSLLTDDDGRTTLEFDILHPNVQLGPNDEVIFSVEAVVEVDPARWPLSFPPSITQLNIPTLRNDSQAWSQWSFPDTKEAGAMVRDDP